MKITQIGGPELDPRDFKEVCRMLLEDVATHQIDNVFYSVESVSSLSGNPYKTITVKIHRHEVDGSVHVDYVMIETETENVAYTDENEKSFTVEPTPARVVFLEAMLKESKENNHRLRLALQECLVQLLIAKGVNPDIDTAIEDAKAALGLE